TSTIQTSFRFTMSAAPQTALVSSCRNSSRAARWLTGLRTIDPQGSRSRGRPDFAWNLFLPWTERIVPSGIDCMRCYVKATHLLNADLLCFFVSALIEVGFDAQPSSRSGSTDVPEHDS